MEDIFVQQIFNLTEQILRGEFKFEPTQNALQNHLAKAQRMGLARYETETLNTLGILYLTAGQAAQHKDYFLRGLEKAEQTHDVDLKMKLLNNLSESYLLEWDFESADQYLDQGIVVARQHHLKTLVVVYLYSNRVNYWLLRGDYAQAARMFDETWQIAENADLLKYSKYEYLQVVFILRNAHALIQIASGKCNAALDSLQLAVHLAQETRSVEFQVSTHLTRLYYELLCNHDEASAQQWEQTALDTNGGKLSYNMALNGAFFMRHNHQPKWAEKYAQLVLDQAASDPNIPTRAVTHARGILAVVTQDLP